MRERGAKYMLLMNHFSGMPMFPTMIRTHTVYMIKQLKRW